MKRTSRAFQGIALLMWCLWAGTSGGSAQTSSTATPTTTTGNVLPYTKYSPWNTPIPSNPHISPSSSQYVSLLTGTFGSDPTQYTFPVYLVDVSTPLVAVKISGSFKTWTCNTCTATSQSGGTVTVPIPNGALPATGTDAQMILWNADTGDEYEFWQMTYSSTGGWTATNGYHYNTQFSAVPASPGPRGAGIPYLAGLVRPWEIAQSRIDHALALGTVSTAPTFVFPATKSDGTTSGGTPEGLRFQLDPTKTDADFSAWGCDATAIILAHALQTYGMIVVDTSGHPKVYVEYEGTANWNGLITGSTISCIPYSAFRALDPAYPIGSASGVSLSPASLTFTGQTVGTTSSAQALTLSNGATSTVSISSIAISGSNSGDFAETSDCGLSLAAGASCAINLTFTPSAIGTRTATLAVADNAPGSPQTATLTGTAVAASTTDSVSPSSLTFAGQTVGTTSSAQVSTLTNTGSNSSTISGIGISGDFAQTNNCAATLAAGSSCAISVIFKPLATGTRTGTVTITDSASNSPQTISLTGTGVSSTLPAVSLTPSSLTFVTQTVGTTSVAQSVKLSNTGNANLSISSINATTPFAQTNNCASSVAAGGSCTISVTFTPTTSGTVTGTLSVADNVGGSPQTISLSGTGASPSVSVSPTSLSFGKVKIGLTSNPQTVAVKNTGSSSVTFSNVQASSGFGVASNRCVGSLAAGASCTIGVTASPTGPGRFTGTLTITDNATGSPQKVGLACRGSKN